MISLVDLLINNLSRTSQHTKPAFSRRDYLKEDLTAEVVEERKRVIFQVAYLRSGASPR